MKSSKYLKNQDTIVKVWFSNFSMHQNPLEGLLKHTLPGPRSSSSVGLQRACQFACLWIAQILLRLLVPGSYFENHWSILLLLTRWVEKTRDSWDDLGSFSDILFARILRLWKLGGLLRFHFFNSNWLQLVCKNQFCVSPLNSEFSDIVEAGNQPWLEYLHHKNGQLF